MHTVPRNELALALDRPTDELTSRVGNLPAERFDSLLQVFPVNSSEALTPLLGEVCYVGRYRSCQLRIQHRSVSRQHAVLRKAEDGWQVTDLGSTNGSTVNEVPAMNTVLKQGDRIQFGDFVFKYLCSRHVEQLYHDVVAVKIRQDDLLNIMNKRVFLGQFADTYKQALDQDTALTVAMLDLDHFKEVNDQFGHHIGDEVLHQCVSRIQSVLPDNAVFARYGGEEFILMFEGFDVQQTVPFAEAILAAVASASFQTSTARIAVTISIGVAGVGQLDVKSYDDSSALINLADTRLFISKRQGRNRISW